MTGVPAVYGVEAWENGWAVVRDGYDLRDRRETPRRRDAAIILYADQVVAEQVAWLLNSQRSHELDPRGAAEKFGDLGPGNP